MLPAAEALRLEEYHRRVGTAWQVDAFTAHDAALEGLQHFPKDPFLRQQQAHALTRTGSLRRARALLEALNAEGSSDPETWGLLGRVWKDLARLAEGETERRQALSESRTCYTRGLQAAESTGDPHGSYPGINAAALSVWLGEPDQAIDFARRAEACATRAPKRDYWNVATLAEAALIRGDLSRACALYGEAGQLAPTAEQLATTRRQARAIARLVHGNESACDACFALAPVTIFIGHLTDAPDRPEPRFPESLVVEVEERLRAFVAASGTRIGYASAARGGDLLFLKALRESGGETQIVLALEKDAFRQASVETPAALHWQEEYEQALTQAMAVRIANRHSSHADGLAFEYATRQLIGLARLRARQLDVELRAAVLWDGRPGDGHGGTAWAVQRLLSLGIETENVHPRQAGPITGAAAPLDDRIPADQRTIRAILFADCKGYSKLREEQILHYTRQYFSGVARLIERSPAPPIFANTWGDGLFLVFRSVGDAAHFALSLRDGAMHHAAELGLPAGISLRIGLHAGPVAPLFDPVTQRPNFVGTNVAMAARIEPITEEDQIFTSEPFAALCAEAGHEDFEFEYLGATAFAKGYGKLPLYQLQTGRNRLWPASG